MIAKPDGEGKHLRLGAAGLRSAASIVQASERALAYPKPTLPPWVCTLTANLPSKVATADVCSGSALTPG